MANHKKFESIGRTLSRHADTTNTILFDEVRANDSQKQKAWQLFEKAALKAAYGADEIREYHLLTRRCGNCDWYCEDTRKCLHPSGEASRLKGTKRKSNACALWELDGMT